MRGGKRAEGASGWICLDNNGNPYSKAVSMVRLEPDGEQVRIEFAGLAWPEGKPPDSNCTVPGHTGGS